ncbi:hypothetical protein BGZ94_005411, partial [Podila epigama]
MMIKEPHLNEDGKPPTFESTVVITFPDVLMAGPRITLSSTPQLAEPNRQSIEQWSQYCSVPSSKKKKTSAGKVKNTPKIVYSALPASADIGLLTVAVAPPTTEQATNLCEAIVNHAQASGTRHIIIVAASNFAGQSAETHGIQLHKVGTHSWKPVQDNISLGDHVLNTFLTLLTFSDIPTTILVHPAKKGSSLRKTKTVIEHLTESLSSVIGLNHAHIFSSTRAIGFDHFKDEEEEAMENM